MNNNVIQILSQTLEEHKEAALVLITRTKGSSPRGVGSMMLVDSNGGILAGTIGGGAAESAAALEAAKCLRQGLSKTISYEFEIESPDPQKLAMVCGGEIELFIRVFKQTNHLLIVGGGHIAQALYQLAVVLGYYIAVIDDRPEILTKERFPSASELILGDVIQELRDYPSHEQTSIVICTYNHTLDEGALAAAIAKPNRYLGMVGSRKKVALCFEHLKAQGFLPPDLDKIHTPIGLKIGGETPEEIALAILAEIQAVKYKENLAAPKDTVFARI
ncbi:xanthine and CO dehydrogenases maturation factor, XdhC/CoxF family [Desulfosporosinus orientis DSM 765]|uniref:Xanthine and CO dehydrogenases maturation factor, XdhC/CoxF family n=1 Tax=Desulfosporosinus orientis (strain ATCC 19365 / DSM 765 / NCIMB 8382 / VKM B-1628 / Singapore I) TaxID=768706 RepID=G7WFX0_DESOD|nr:XdhC/CoxI family protein [Desulfosporosinus orientis]AET69485.1 xanthine and CO dehydrogenases maturation factor, XdhC/CoxF family [Desulfosporosinus orientis DSM 765]